MDALDVAILREVSRTKIFWWGGLDPRISTEIIARRLEVAGSTIRARLSQWERAGFLRGIDVIPNPALFGARLAGGSLRVHDTREKERILQDLALVEGVKMALDHVGPWVAIILISQTDREIERTRQLIARLPGVAEVSPCIAYTGPASTLVPTPLDWRLLAELRAEPRARVHEIAERAGMSSRTVTRRYAALMKSNAVLFWLMLDFTKMGGVVGRIIVTPAANARMRTIQEALQERVHDAVELWPPQEGYILPEAFDVMVYRDNVAAVEEAESLIRNIPGVAEVETLYPKRIHSFGEWVDGRIAAICGKERGARRAHGPL